MGLRGEGLLPVAMLLARVAIVGGALWVQLNEAVGNVGTILVLASASATVVG